MLDGESKHRKDVEEVMEQEKRRGKSRGGPIDFERVKRQRQREKECRELLRTMDIRQFKKAMKTLGLKPEMEEYSQLLAIWREFQQDLRDEKNRFHR